MSSSDRINVPCGPCRLCCKLHTPLHPEKGDDLASYDTARWYDGVTGAYKGLILWRVPDGPNKGDCIYLTTAGCSIWERAPYACRTFDCRELSKLPAAQRKARIDSGDMPKDIFMRGHELREAERVL